MITHLEHINPLNFKRLYELLNKIKLTQVHYNGSGNRHGFPDHRRATFGMVKQRVGGLVGLSRDSILYPEIFDELTRIGDTHCPFPYTSIHINHNLTCSPHKDSHNNGNSMLVSFGEYFGSNIVVCGQVYNTYCRPLIFNGSEYEHWNTDDLIGNKYSLVYYNNNFCLNKTT